jgi:hypothetical protein
MLKLVLASTVLAALLVACSAGAPATPSAPAATPTPGATQAAPSPTPPGSGNTTPAANTGNAEAIVRALVPPGATEVSKVETGDFFSLSLSSSQSIAELEAFFDQKLPSTGVTVSGKFTAAGTLTIAFTNPDGGITATPDGSGGTLVVITAGIQ